MRISSFDKRHKEALRRLDRMTKRLSRLEKWSKAWAKRDLKSEEPLTQAQIDGREVGS